MTIKNQIKTRTRYVHTLYGAQKINRIDIEPISPKYSEGKRY